MRSKRSKRRKRPNNECSRFKTKSSLKAALQQKTNAKDDYATRLAEQLQLQEMTVSWGGWLLCGIFYLFVSFVRVLAVWHGERLPNFNAFRVEPQSGLKSDKFRLVQALADAVDEQAAVAQAARSPSRAMLHSAQPTQVTISAGLLNQMPLPTVASLTDNTRQNLFTRTPSRGQDEFVVNLSHPEVLSRMPPC